MLRRPWFSAPVSVGLALVAAGCGGGGGGTGTSGGASTPVAEYGCTACHKIGGEGNGAVGGDLSHVGAKLDRAQLRDKLLNPPSGMPALSSVADADLDRIVAFLARQR